jgi:hypothetical protein
VLGNPTKFSRAEQHLQDFYKEEKEGYKVQSNSYKVNVIGMPQTTAELSDDISEEIDEEIHTDREQN